MEALLVAQMETVLAVSTVASAAALLVDAMDAEVVASSEVDWVA
jgi:hypothetical protein